MARGIIDGDVSIKVLRSDGDLRLTETQTGEHSKEAYSEYPDYDGEYTVTPDWESQTLKTQNKIMRSDVVVGAIYLNSAQNPAGGNTVYIGG